MPEEKRYLIQVIRRSKDNPSNASIYFVGKYGDSWFGYYLQDCPEKNQECRQHFLSTFYMKRAYKTRRSAWNMMQAMLDNPNPWHYDAFSIIEI